MSDPCCGGEVEVGGDGAGGLSERWKSVAAGLSALMWTFGVVAGFADAPFAADGAFIMAVVVGGATFVPGAVTGLVRGRLGDVGAGEGDARPHQALSRACLARRFLMRLCFNWDRRSTKTLPSR